MATFGVVAKVDRYAAQVLLEGSTGLRRCGIAYSCPWRKCISHTKQTRLQTGKVPQQNRTHRVIANPVHPRLAIYLFRKVGSEEPVAVQPSRCHQHKNAEGRVTEAESLRRSLGE